jgi:Protein of unknown function (DUF2924)
MRQQRTEAAAIDAEIARLRSLAPDALQRRWRVVFGRTPPAGLSKDLLGRMIAWRMQEQAFGGLDRESLRFLEGLARRGGSPRGRLKPGTVLVRDYRGQRHTITVASDGFDWQGTTYPSLRPSPARLPAQPGVVLASSLLCDLTALHQRAAGKESRFHEWTRQQARALRHLYPQVDRA